MKMPITDALLAAVLGYGVVFFGLILLMAVVVLMGKVMVAGQDKARQAAPAPAAPAPAPAPVKPVSKPAPGSAGEVKLFDVPDREAAMLMAIVAEKMGRPLNELRFKSMKEVK